jgi:predicted lipoprotein with Yx(FWY)xxD motif
MKLASLAAAVLTATLAAALATAAGAAPAAEPAAAEVTGTKTLIVRSTRFGRILFDGRGRVLYAFTRDRRGGPSRCYGDCAAAWPVYFKKGALTAGTGVKRSLLGTTKRRDGRLQVTYNGWPLYYYAHEKAGEVKCQNVVTHGGTWLVVAPSGKPVR